MAVSLERRVSPEQDRRTNQLWVFPGQGAVHRNEYAVSPVARDIVNLFDEIVGGEEPFSKRCKDENSDFLARSENAHLALILAGVSKIAAGVEDGSLDPNPRFIVGASAGAVPALIASGVLSFENGIYVGRERGRLTQEASDGLDAKMATVIGKEGTESLDVMVDEVCRRVTADAQDERVDAPYVGLSGVYSPRAMGMSGDRRLMEQVKAELKGQVAKVIMLDGITIVSHTPYMESAKDKFNEFIQDIPFCDPQIPLIMNGEIVTSGEEAKRRLPLELVDPVFFMKSVQLARKHGAQGAIEFQAAADNTPRWARFAAQALGENEKEFAQVR